MSILRFTIGCAAAIIGWGSGTLDARAQLAVANCLEETPHIGIAKGADANEANSNAIAACLKNGGYDNCCNIYATIIRGASGQKTICLSGAQGYNGDFGYGTGVNKNASISAAISNCKIGAVSPKNCGHVVSTACQTNP